FERTRSCGGDRGDVHHAGHREPRARGEDVPGRLGTAVGSGGGNAHHGPAPRRPRQWGRCALRRRDGEGAGPGDLQPARDAARPDGLDRGTEHLMAGAVTASPARTWQYRARNEGGKVVKGRLDAPTESAAIDRVRTLGLAPISVLEAKAGTGLNREIEIGGGKRVGLKDL